MDEEGLEGRQKKEVKGQGPAMPQLEKDGGSVPTGSSLQTSPAYRSERAAGRDGASMLCKGCV